ncbi:hypothetical protein DPMN_120027 [Dreissena polymorpha]|nr:hypothetical protein DPMN_120027 [Dreissena polymorpha]KAH3818416.1 hypothetical protein DPMN_120027 [Dreissena polymorpha]
MKANLFCTFLVFFLAASHGIFGIGGVGHMYEYNDGIMGDMEMDVNRGNGLDGGMICVCLDRPWQTWCPSGYREWGTCYNIRYWKPKKCCKG